jgi:hypothetical protein
MELFSIIFNQQNQNIFWKHLNHVDENIFY